MSQQQVPTGPAPIEGAERTNTIMVNPQQRVGFLPRNPYTMDVDQGNRNCYTYRGFGYLARNCRNQGIEMSRRIETENNTNNLNGEGGLGSPN